MLHSDYGGISDPVLFFLEGNLSFRQMDSRTPQGNRPAERQTRLKSKKFTFVFDAKPLVAGFVFFSRPGLPAQLFSVTKTVIVLEGVEGNSIL